MGKGITAASLGMLLGRRGLKVAMQKFDPYLNVDPGTMNPYQHGELYVTDDGAETDLDLGHYERFTGIATNYGTDLAHERHRHRYELNNQYRDRFAARGMRFSGTSPDGQLVEIMELPEHPWFVAVQFHPEFKSTPIKPHPLFVDFIGRALLIDG